MITVLAHPHIHKPYVHVVEDHAGEYEILIEGVCVGTCRNRSIPQGYYKDIKLNDLGKMWLGAAFQRVSEMMQHATYKAELDLYVNTTRRLVSLCTEHHSVGPLTADVVKWYLLK